MRAPTCTSRYGLRARLMETASRGFVIVDPSEREDFIACVPVSPATGWQVIRQRPFGPEAWARLLLIGPDGP